MRRISSLANPGDFAIEQQREALRGQRSQRRRLMMGAVASLVVALTPLIVALAVLVLRGGELPSMLTRLP